LRNELRGLAFDRQTGCRVPTITADKKDQPPQSLGSSGSPGPKGVLDHSQQCLDMLPSHNADSANNSFSRTSLSFIIINDQIQFYSSRAGSIEVDQ
jgi:hypothetical protein